MFFIVFLGLFGFYRYRLAQLLKLQSIRNEISKDLHDDIGSTLSSITVLSEVARSKMQEGQQEQSISVLGKINSYSLEMVEKMSDIVWAVNSGNDHLEDLIQRIKKASAETCSLKNIKLNFEVDENFKKLLLPIASRRNIYLICRESINNAIKHAECDLIELIFKIHSGMIEIMIRDNGKGFDTLKENTGNGLKNIQFRVLEINGKASIYSKPNNTMIVVQIPVPKIR
jgi:signal transduction histidine kinase